MMENLEMTKSSSTALLFHHNNLVDEIKMIKQNLHMIIEQLAEKEQTEDLQGFLRRESVFDSGKIEDHEAQDLEFDEPK